MFEREITEKYSLPGTKGEIVSFIASAFAGRSVSRLVIDAEDGISITWVCSPGEDASEPKQLSVNDAMDTLEMHQLPGPHEDYVSAIKAAEKFLLEQSPALTPTTVVLSDDTLASRESCHLLEVLSLQSRGVQFSSRIRPEQVLVIGSDLLHGSAGYKSIALAFVGGKDA